MGVDWAVAVAERSENRFERLLCRVFAVEPPHTRLRMYNETDILMSHPEFLSVLGSDRAQFLLCPTSAPDDRWAVPRDCATLAWCAADASVVQQAAVARLYPFDGKGDGQPDGELRAIAAYAPCPAVCQVWNVQADDRTPIRVGRPGRSGDVGPDSVSRRVPRGLTKRAQGLLRESFMHGRMS